MLSVSNNRLIWLACVSLLHLLPSCESVSCTTPPFEEGRTGTIVCNAPINTRNITWFLEVDGQFVQVSSCDSKFGCQNVSSRFSSSVRNSTDGKAYQSLLTINNVSRREVTYKCTSDGGFDGVVCSIEVYVKPQTPICNSSIAYSTNEVAISCYTDKVYPEAVCLYTFPTGTNFLMSARVYYMTTVSTTNAAYNATVCTLTVDVSEATPGNYTLSLIMMPKVSKITQAMISQSATDPVLSLIAPSAFIDGACPPNGPHVNGTYIDARYGSQTTCRCVLDNIGLPHGEALWNQRGNSIGVKNNSDGSSTLRLTYNISDPNPSFQCLAKSVLNTTPAGITYQPQYAIGPNVITTTTSDPIFDLCTSPSRNITVTCTVPMDQSNLEPMFSISIDSQLPVWQQTGQLTTSGYSYSTTFRPETGGNVLVVCQAQNPMFSDLQTSKVATVQIREPPKAAPSISLIQSGDTVSVICFVEGGFPNVQSVSLKCGSEQKDSEGNRAILVLNALKSLNNEICSCTAVHATRCYEQRSNVLLKVDGNGNTSAAETSDPSKLPIIVGLAVGIGSLAIVLVGVVVLLMRRRKRRRQPSEPPTYVAEWVNDNKFMGARDGYIEPPVYSRYVIPPAYSPPEKKEEIYDEICPEEDYITVDVSGSTPPSHRNAAFHIDYILPIP